MKLLTVVILACSMYLPAWGQDSLGMGRVSELDFWYDVHDMQIVGERAYISSSMSGLHIMDMTDPVHPAEIGREPWYPWCNQDYAVYVEDDKAYVSAYFGGYVLDVLDPARPVVLGEWHGGYQWPSISFVYDGMAVAQNDEDCPRTMDVSDPQNVHEVGWFEGIGAAWPLGMVGDSVMSYLCLNGYEGLSVWDISDPAQPVLVAIADTAHPAWTWSATLSGHIVYRSTQDGRLRVFDLCNPLEPVEIAVCDSGGCGSVTVTGTHLIVSKMDTLLIWNVSDPSHPVLEGALPGIAGDLASSGDYVYVYDYRRNFTVTMVDISVPSAPEIVGEFGPVGNMRRIAVSETVGYLAGLSPGLYTVDLTDLADISILGLANGYGADMAVRGNYAYLASGRCGLCTIDVTNPAQPESLGCVGTAGIEAYRIVTWGDYAYLLGLRDGGRQCLFIFSLDHPAAPVLADSMLCDVGCLAAADGYLYVTNPDLRIFTLANPTAPQLLSWYDLPQVCFDITAQGDRVYLACGSGIHVLDVSDPQTPQEVALMAGTTRAVDVAGQMLFAGGSDGIRAFDISDLAHPDTVGHFSTLEEFSDLTVYESYLLALSEYAFRVYACDALPIRATRPAAAPEVFALHPCFPNPFNATTEIRFEVPRSALVQLRVYDLQGRLVETPVSRVFDAGIHSITFDASNRASGMYIVQMKSGDFSESQKVILLK